MGMFGRFRSAREADVSNGGPPPAQARLQVFACGAGLFSDGYINNVIGAVTTVLALEYGSLYTSSNAKRYVSAIAFAGTVFGQLAFGILTDKWSRINSLLISTAVLIVFCALAAGSYYHGDPVGMFNMLTAWRFFVGIGIGGEYPAGSAGCAEASGELKAGSRNLWFILCTNSAIDVGFVFGAFVPYVVAAVGRSLNDVWRASLGVGAVVPLLLFVLRLRLREPETFTQESLKGIKTPYWPVLQLYGSRLVVLALIWGLYDFSSFSFGLYSSTIIANVNGSNATLAQTLGWNVVITLFYLPGTLLGAPFSDWLGPRLALSLGVALQALVGFAMAGGYAHLAQPGNVAGFAVVYGLFLSLGEFGPGNNIGLLAAKSSPTAVRGQFYAVAAACGKVGAFVGTLVFPYLAAAGGSDVASAQYPFWVSSSLCVLSAVLALFCLPHVGQDAIEVEDARFRALLAQNGFDTRQSGLASLSMENGPNTAPTKVGEADAK